jgi:hypothetical protein
MEGPCHRICRLGNEAAQASARRYTSRQISSCQLLSVVLAVPEQVRREKTELTLLVARTSGARPHRAPDASGLREALCQATEERRS